jgi:predicted 3-demethylubiquinone-9 3-methyltransferase (glyoxalase superfamily)
MKSVLPFLMFQGRAVEALDFYVSLFGDDAAVEEIVRWGEGEAGPKGSVQRAWLRLKDQRVICLDSPVKHAFDFTPSFSFFIECDSEAELDRLAAGLLDGGTALMPPGAYGFSRKFAWVNDRFGVSWQVNLA